MLPPDHVARIERARLCLDGLSLGDAFGNCFFANPRVVERMIELCALPAGPWYFTDDTVMALAITEMLEEQGRIDPDGLASAFASKYERDPQRGYGGTAHEVLQRIAAEEDWREVAPSVFAGAGSMGNGGAMRAAPIGAYFCDDLRKAARNARLSAQVTHAHPEGQAGAIAVAIAAACVAASCADPQQLFETVVEYVPDGETRAGIIRAADLSLDDDVRNAAIELGNGTQVLSQDTVPFAIWCAARHLDDYEQALWTTVAGLGDRDTTCAIVGGIIALSADTALPENWLSEREDLAVMEG